MAKGWSKEGQEGSTGLARKFRLRIPVGGSRITTPEGWDRPVWVLKGEAELPDGERKDMDIRMSMGDFEPGDAEGTYALHSSQDMNKPLSGSSSAMKFIKTAFAIPELSEILQERSRVIDGVDLESKDVAIWDGLDIEVEHYEEMRKNPQTGVEKQALQPFVAAFYGTVDGAVAASPAAAQSNGTITEDEARALAKSSANYVEYLTKVVEEKGLDAGHAYAQNDFYSSSK